MLPYRPLSKTVISFRVIYLCSLEINYNPGPLVTLSATHSPSETDHCQSGVVLRIFGSNLENHSSTYSCQVP